MIFELADAGRRGPSGRRKYRHETGGRKNMSKPDGQGDGQLRHGIPWEMKEYPVPDPEPGAIVTQDHHGLHLWHGRPSVQGDFGGPDGVRQKPSISGHEFVGRVHKLGEGVSVDTAGRPLKEGDRVVWSPSILCGQMPRVLERDSPLPQQESPRRHHLRRVAAFQGSFRRVLLLGVRGNGSTKCPMRCPTRPRSTLTAQLPLSPTPSPRSTSPWDRGA